MDLPSNSCFDGGFRDGVGDGGCDFAVEHAGDDVVRVKLVVADDAGDGDGCGEFHVVGDRVCSHIEQASEQSGETQDVIALVRVIRTAGRHDLYVRSGFFGHDLGIGIGECEDDRIVGHAFDIVGGNEAGSGDADQNVGSFHCFGQ